MYGILVTTPRGVFREPRVWAKFNCLEVVSFSFFRSFSVCTFGLLGSSRFLLHFLDSSDEFIPTRAIFNWCFLVAGVWCCVSWSHFSCSSCLTLGEFEQLDPSFYFRLLLWVSLIFISFLGTFDLSFDFFGDFSYWSYLFTETRRMLGDRLLFLLIPGKWLIPDRDFIGDGCGLTFLAMHD